MDVNQLNTWLAFRMDERCGITNALSQQVGESTRRYTSVEPKELDKDACGQSSKTSSSTFTQSDQFPNLRKVWRRSVLPFTKQGHVGFAGRYLPPDVPNAASMAGVNDFFEGLVGDIKLLISCAEFRPELGRLLSMQSNVVVVEASPLFRLNFTGSALLEKRSISKQVPTSSDSPMICAGSSGVGRIIPCIEKKPFQAAKDTFENIVASIATDAKLILPWEQQIGRILPVGLGAFRLVNLDLPEEYHNDLCCEFVAALSLVHPYFTCARDSRGRLCVVLTPCEVKNVSTIMDISSFIATAIARLRLPETVSAKLGKSLGEAIKLAEAKRRGYLDVLPTVAVLHLETIKLVPLLGSAIEYFIPNPKTLGASFDLRSSSQASAPLIETPRLALAAAPSLASSDPAGVQSHCGTELKAESIHCPQCSRVCIHICYYLFISSMLSPSLLHQSQQLRV
jgi:hypothetical protein